jgi:alpha-L-glutamate ligase-like protein
VKVDKDALSGLLGINERNLAWIYEYNSRKFFPQADDKIKTKEILAKHGVPVPETLEIIDSFINLEKNLQQLETYEDIVIKPSMGRAGGGILLLHRSGPGKWQTPSGKPVSEGELIAHFGEILFGVYSFGSNDDRVLVERKISPHSFFLRFYPDGVADIRIILFRAKPVMAMSRIPTKSSDGKANLHQGAIGVGMDLESGEFICASYHGASIDCHPDSGMKLTGEKIPFWDSALDIAAKAARAVDLLYLGVDIVIDQDRGPMILELNARPGLEIQVANHLLLGKELGKIE